MSQALFFCVAVAVGVGADFLLPFGGFECGVGFEMDVGAEWDVAASAWIASCVCHDVPHCRVVFIIPRVLLGIFRKRRKLYTIIYRKVPAQDAVRHRDDLAAFSS